MQSINSILACGYIPGLFSSQEFDSFLPALRDLASQDAYHGDLHTYFASSETLNLYIWFEVEKSINLKNCRSEN